MGRFMKAGLCDSFVSKFVVNIVASYSLGLKNLIVHK